MKNKAFTLIELLVVIAIIAILAAILFPVFAQAKNASKKTQSLSNSKNQITAVLMYMGDFEDVMPFSEAGCDRDESQVQWYATVYPYMKSGRNYLNVNGELRAWGNDGIFLDPAHPDKAQGQHYGLNRDLFPSNFCVANAADIVPSFSASAVENQADKLAIGIKNKNGPFWSYPYFSADEWMWTARYKKVNGEVVTDGSEIQSGLAPRDWGYVMNKDCYGDNQGFEECGAALSFRYNGQSIGSFLDGHSSAIGKGRLKWFTNVAFNNGYRWWKESWYPYNGY
jgi:prepilin-type N-terminal cleavage/methylation domain-containing protein